MTNIGSSIILANDEVTVTPGTYLISFTIGSIVRPGGSIPAFTVNGQGPISTAENDTISNTIVLTFDTSTVVNVVYSNNYGSGSTEINAIYSAYLTLVRLD